jgi:hypothetical protein
MNHLGGCGFEWFMLSGSLGSCHRTSVPPGVSHLWMATQEQRDVQVMKLPVQPQDIWALSWPTKLQELKPDGQRMVDVGRMKRVWFGLRECF